MASEPLLTERFELRFSKEMLQSIDRWRSSEEKLPPRAEAIRHLIELGLEATKVNKEAAK